MHKCRIPRIDCTKKEAAEMEQVIVDIPQVQDEPKWTPPAVELQEEPGERVQSAADVFFMQYAVCILLLTALLLLRLCDREAGDSVTAAFRAQSSAPDAPWVTQFMALIGGLWS